VDIESTSVEMEIGLGTRSAVLTATELRRVTSASDPTKAFLRHWTVKECLVKVGAATLDTMAEVDVGAETDRRTAGGRAASRYGQLYLMDWFDEQLDAMVAVVGSRPPEIVPFALSPDTAPGTARCAW
jgi:4'-phosphopantetheinyl transferase